MLGISCNKDKKSPLSILTEEGVNDCRKIKELIDANQINVIDITRPLGKKYETTIYNLNELDAIFGARLFTLGNEKFECRDINALLQIEENTLKINYTKSGFDNSGPFSKEYVESYWEPGNAYFLNKKIPSIKASTYAGETISLDEIVSQNDSTLLHFGFLACIGCMKEQTEINEMKENGSKVNFISVTTDTKETLDKYLVDKGDYYEVLPPYNKFSKKITKPLIMENKRNISNEFQHFLGYPINFFVNKKGVVEKTGKLDWIFEKDNVDVTYF